MQKHYLFASDPLVYYNFSIPQVKFYLKTPYNWFYLHLVIVYLIQTIHLNFLISML